MSSYVMHICVSDIVKRKLNLTDKFVFGAILPDLLKNQGEDRDPTHYIETVVVDGDIRKLPNIQKAIDELVLMDDEIKLGYIAHLVEDLIWFNDFIPTYAKKTEQDGKVIYLKDGTVHDNEEFNQEIYLDYTNSNEYVAKKCDVNIDDMIENLLGIACGQIAMKPLIQNSICPKGLNYRNNKFMTKESIDKYIEVCTKEVEKIILSLMGE